MIALIAKLIFAHVLADFALQTTSMAMGKCRKKQAEEKSGCRYHQGPNWPYWLTAHAIIHGGAVWLATGNIILGLAEVFLHWIIDFAKCENWTNIHADQILHMACKAAYLFFI
jgi:hypothetical protein